MHIKNRTPYQTTYSKNNPFMVSSKGAKPVTVKAGEVVFSGMYKFNLVKEPLFSMELITRKRSARNYVENAVPN